MGRFVEIRLDSDDGETVVYRFRGIGSSTAGAMSCVRSTGDISLVECTRDDPSRWSDVQAALYKLEQARDRGEFPDRIDFIS